MSPALNTTEVQVTGNKKVTTLRVTVTSKPVAGKYSVNKHYKLLRVAYGLLQADLLSRLPSPEQIFFFDVILTVHRR